MHHAERAIILAAGMGERMRPVTEQTPKPLVPVRGRRMIDTIITALRENGITEIYVVVGYRREQFAALPKQYPGLTLIENPDYAETNNISSLYYASAYLENTIILDGDQIIRNPEILRPEFDRSCYCCYWTEKETSEWLLTLENDVVIACSRTGGRRGWELHSVSFWSEEDGARLRKHLKQEYESGNREIYWDDVALTCYPGEYQLGVRPMNDGSLVEIDSYEELCALDPSYQ